MVLQLTYCMCFMRYPLCYQLCIMAPTTRATQGNPRIRGRCACEVSIQQSIESAGPITPGVWRCSKLMASGIPKQPPNPLIWEYPWLPAWWLMSLSRPSKLQPIRPLDQTIGGLLFGGRSIYFTKYIEINRCKLLEASELSVAFIITCSFSVCHSIV